MSVPILISLLWASPICAQEPDRGSRLLQLRSENGNARLTGGRDYALLIGIDQYDYWEDLDNPVTDIHAVGRELEEVYGFIVEKLINPTRCGIVLKLREYHNRQYSREDQLFIMFSGHGAFDDLSETGYLVTRESRALEQDGSFCSLLPYPIKLIDRIPAHHILLIADACFAGTLDPKVASKGEDIHSYRTNEDFIDRKMALKTRRYITAGGKEYVSDGRPGHHSPFTRGLLEGLRTFGGSDGILTLDELISSHLETVGPTPRWSDFGDNDPGSSFLFIIKSRRVAPDDVPLPQDPSEADSYCRAGGIRNIEKGVQMFRQIVGSLPLQTHSRLDTALLARAEQEFRSGSPEKACSLYRALFHALYRQINR